MNKVAISIASVVAAVAVPQQAHAVIQTIATFSAPTSAANFRFVNSGNSANRATDAIFYSTTTGTSTSAGSVLTTFSFLDPFLAAYVTNVSSSFTLNGTVAKNTPATAVGPLLLQTGVSGTFSFLSTSAITVGGPNFVPHTYAAGSNLLSGTFGGATIIGSTSSGSLIDSGGPTITFSSDFLDFTPTVSRDLAFSLGSILPSLAQATGANKALRTFRATAGGQFSSDPAPLVNGLALVPEPATWAMMMMGFGAMGGMMRYRRREAKIAYA